MNMDKEKRWNLIAAGFCAVLASVILYLSYTTFVKMEAKVGGPFAGTGFFPRIVAGAIIFLSILLAVSSLTKKGGAAKPAVGFDEETPVDAETEEKWKSEENTISRGLIIAFAFLLLTYTLLMELFGYLIVTPFFLILFFWILKVKNWAINIALSLTTTFVLYLIFALLLNVILPSGKFSVIGW